jgi:hypothetical protein
VNLRVLKQNSAPEEKKLVFGLVVWFIAIKFFSVVVCFFRILSIEPSWVPPLVLRVKYTRSEQEIDPSLGFTKFRHNVRTTIETHTGREGEIAS